jgi:flagellin
MAYILNNASANTALLSLQMTQQNLATTQKQLSTGLKIESAADNASYWAISQTMRSDNGAIGAVSSSLNQTSSDLATTTSALTSVLSTLNAMKATITTAGSLTGSAAADALASLNAQGAQLKSIVTAATTNSGNLLDGTVATANFVASYSDGGGAVASVVSTIDLTTLPLTGATGALTKAKATAGATAATDFTTLVAADIANGTATTGNAQTLSNIDKAIADVTTYAALVGSTAARVTDQQNFITNQQTNLTNSISSMVDADMNQVSTRLQALQTQQQLGVQSLSIANQSSQMILKLFQ